MKMEQTECTETLAYKIQTPENYPEENIQQINTSYYIRKDELDGLNDTYGRGKRCIQCFGGKPEGKYYLEDLGIDRRIILKWILEE